MKVLRSIWSAAAVVVLAFGGLTAMAAPASAAEVICESKFSGIVWLPTDRPTGSYSCYMYRTYGNATAVYAFQYSYNRCYHHLGWPGLTPTGVYGDATVRAVKNVQTYHGIKSDGYYGPATAAVLRYAVDFQADCGRA